MAKLFLPVFLLIGCFIHAQEIESRIYYNRYEITLFSKTKEGAKREYFLEKKVIDSNEILWRIKIRVLKPVTKAFPLQVYNNKVYVSFNTFNKERDIEGFETWLYNFKNRGYEEVTFGLGILLDKYEDSLLGVTTLHLEKAYNLVDSTSTDSLKRFYRVELRYYNGLLKNNWRVDLPHHVSYRDQKALSKLEGKIINHEAYLEIQLLKEGSMIGQYCFGKEKGIQYEMKDIE